MSSEYVTHARPKVLIIDQSLALRKSLAGALQDGAKAEIVGVASTLAAGLHRAAAHRPDLILLDADVAGEALLESISALHSASPDCQVIVSAAGDKARIQPCVRRKAVVVSRQDIEAAARGEIAGILRWPDQRKGDGERREFPIRGVPLAKLARAIVIGVSTGGPEALARILPAFDENLAVPVFIVQHIPPMFATLLAHRLNQKCSLPVVEATSGMLVCPGKVYLARGDWHMKLLRQRSAVTIELDQAAPENSCRPAVDVLFRSAADVYNGEVVAVVLTGMGQDGLLGVRVLKERGAHVIIQDQTTSVVWGMPGAIAEASLYDEMVPLDEIVPAVMRRL